MNAMLERFRQAKQAEIDELRSLAATRAMPTPLAGLRPGFAEALRKADGIAVIAEYKRASPSKGPINLGISPAEAAKAYAKAGAAALSVLTEERYFQGSLSFLAEIRAAVDLPLLRKDFLFDPLQVRATLATPASAVLVIVRMLTDAALTGLLHEACACGLDAVVEVFDEADLDRAKNFGATIIQVNNRDLDTLTTDLGTSRRLAARKEPGELWISASGLSTPEHLADMAAHGFDAALVGTALMQGKDPGAMLSAMRKGS